MARMLWLLHGHAKDQRSAVTSLQLRTTREALGATGVAEDKSSVAIATLVGRGPLRCFGG